jgi:hypothetical protein
VSALHARLVAVALSRPGRVCLLARAALAGSADEALGFIGAGRVRGGACAQCASGYSRVRIPSAERVQLLFVDQRPAVQECDHPRRRAYGQRHYPSHRGRRLQCDHGASWSGACARWGLHFVRARSPCLVSEHERTHALARTRSHTRIQAIHARASPVCRWT